MSERRAPGDEGGIVARLLLFAAVVWLVAFLAGVPVAVDAVDRIKGWRDDAQQRAEEALPELPDRSELPSLPTPDPWSPPEDRRPGSRPGATATPELPPATPAAVSAALDSVVQVVIARCRQGGSGSGFVVGPDRVVTNAHVVEGATAVRVRTPAGKQLVARVVEYDAGTDVAVLAVANLDVAPLSYAGRAGRGQRAWVAGHPLGGPLKVVQATVLGTSASSRPDLESYVLRARVRPGNSGGPVLDARGDVLGVVFAASATRKQFGFARTAGAVEYETRRGVRGDASVEHGQC